MALESASYIHQLNQANPSSGDTAEQGDDHIRLLKAVLRATFPNFTGPLTASNDDLNALAGLALESILNPTGTIILWYGATNAIPAGWALCNGGTYNRADGTGTIKTPDLRGRVPVGAGGAYAVNTAFGAETVTTGSGGAASGGTVTTSVAGAHTHTGKTGATALTASQLPQHTHPVAGHRVIEGAFVPYINRGTSFSSLDAGITIPSFQGRHAHWTEAPELVLDNDGVSDDTYQKADTAANMTVTTGGVSGLSGSTAGHTHTISSDGAHTHTITLGATSHSHSVDVRQPSLALAYIMKL